MSLQDIFALQPDWVMRGLGILFLVFLAELVVLLFSKATFWDAAVVFTSNKGGVLLMLLFANKLGRPGLAWFGHGIAATLVALYLWDRLDDPKIVTPFRQVMWLLLATILVALAFDYVDAARYLLGGHHALVSPAQG